MLGFISPSDNLSSLVDHVTDHCGCTWGRRVGVCELMSTAPSLTRYVQEDGEDEVVVVAEGHVEGVGQLQTPLVGSAYYRDCCKYQHQFTLGEEEEERRDEGREGGRGREETKGGREGGEETKGRRRREREGEERRRWRRMSPVMFIPGFLLGRGCRTWNT